MAEAAASLGHALKRLIYGVPSDFVPSQAPLTHEKIVELMNTIYDEYRREQHKMGRVRPYRSFEQVHEVTIRMLIEKYQLQPFEDEFRLFIEQQNTLKDTEQNYEARFITNATYGIETEEYVPPEVHYPAEIANHINQLTLALQAEALTQLRAAPMDITSAVMRFLTPEEQHGLTVALGHHHWREWRKGGTRRRKKSLNKKSNKKICTRYQKYIK